MTPAEIKVQQKSREEKKKEDFSGKLINQSAKSLYSYASTENPWTPDDVDKFGMRGVESAEDYHKVVNSCRFFYRRDPLASIVINRMVELSINSLLLSKKGMKSTEFDIYESILPDLQEFLESCAVEYLVSGLVMPNVEFKKYTKRDLAVHGIKYKSSLILPDYYWLRDPASIIINVPFAKENPSFFVKIPERLRHFIQNKGVYPDLTDDKKLYQQIVKDYPELIKAVETHEPLPLPEDVFYIRRRFLSDSPYPVPFLYSALESMKHKRNLKRMDYSVTSRVISAIQHFKAGDKDFPLVDEDDTQLESLREQIKWRDSNGMDIERIFQLFTNHTVTIEWVYPDTKLLLDNTKYASVDSDIVIALGFPRILLTGETERSGTSNSSVAVVAPTRTMENMRNKLIKIARDVLFDVAEKNGLKSLPKIRLAPINLYEFKDFIAGLQELYKTGNLSREDYSSVFGYEFEETAGKIQEEQELIEEMGIPEFSPVPFSEKPGATDTGKDETKTEPGSSTN